MLTLRSFSQRDVGVAAKKPQKFDDDRPKMQLLGRQQRKALPEVEAHLRAEGRQRARPGAVLLFDTLVEYPLHELEILAHGATVWMFVPASNRAPS